MTEILRLENVGKQFGGIHAVNDVSFSLVEGEIIGLIGPNGAGKTTLVNLITGVHPLSSGKVRPQDGAWHGHFRSSNPFPK